jgi:anti-sigma regulatory factor (Ser/Thr protein kinase)
VPRTHARTHLRVVPDESPRTFAAHFARTPAAAGAARRLVTHHFGDLLREEPLDDVLLVVSELVTNAVLYGHGEIELRLAFDGPHLMGAVNDEGSGFGGELPPADPARVGGHGLYIVGRVAEAWGRGEGPASIWFRILAHA